MNNTSYHSPVQDESDSCFNGSASLASRGYGYFFNGSGFSIGRPQLCSVNEYVPVCTSISEDEATVICYSSEGQYGELNQGLFFPVNYMKVDIEINCIEWQEVTNTAE